MRYWTSLGSDVGPSDGFSDGSLDWYSVQIVVDDDDDQRRTENDVEKEKENNLTVLHEVSPSQIRYRPIKPPMDPQSVFLLGYLQWLQ